MGIDELVEDPQLLARDMLIEIEHPVAGKVKYPGNPIIKRGGIRIGLA
ncbi:MAG TPA: hypothetical protein VN381_05290 [Anaerovoracaceae bacterium]|nr:hypothetical protein [Anaerovoracaceae bacterium]